MSRNEDALFHAVRMALDCDVEDCDECMALAGRLAARGVLAIDSLTDEQLDAAVHYGHVTTTKGIRAALRRCATGEDT